MLPHLCQKSHLSSGKIVHIGKYLAPDEDMDSVPKIEGAIPVFPIRDNGIEMNWGLVGEELKKRLEKGYVRVGKYTPQKHQKYVLSYLTTGAISDIESGKAEIRGYGNDGSVKAYYTEEKKSFPTTQWSFSSHDAKNFGTGINQCFIPNRDFSYPKSLYAVEDVLKIFVSDKPDALIVDFFAGSGTTANAVMLLNHLDKGNRRTVSVTNNDVGYKEEKEFASNGLRPYDDKWEEKGIANYITWPRIKSCITGVDTLGNVINGNYKFTEEFPMSDGFKANAIFCELTYESAWPIRLDNAFDAIAPILWMQAGCRGPIIRRIGKSFSATDYYGVLFDYNHVSKFCDTVKSTPSIKTVFVVTDDQRRYSNVCRRLPGVEVHRLYETYLRTFEICGEGGLD